MENVRKIVVDVSAVASSERKMILDKLEVLTCPEADMYASDNDGRDFLCIDEDGDVDSGDFPSAFMGNSDDTFLKYVPEQFWEEFGSLDEEDDENPVKLPENNRKMKPEELEFGHVLHICGTPYVFIKLEHDGLIATVNQYGVIRRSDATTFDEFEDLPIEQREQDFLKLWRSQGIDFAQDTMNDEIAWSVEGFFKFIEQHRESIVEIFEEK